MSQRDTGDQQILAADLLEFLVLSKSVELGGSMKDDPLLMDELEEIYKRRRQDVIEDGE